MHPYADVRMHALNLKFDHLDVEIPIVTNVWHFQLLDSWEKEQASLVALPWHHNKGRELFIDSAHVSKVMQL